MNNKEIWAGFPFSAKEYEATRLAREMTIRQIFGEDTLQEYKKVEDADDLDLFDVFEGKNHKDIDLFFDQLLARGVEQRLFDDLKEAKSIFYKVEDGFARNIPYHPEFHHYFPLEISLFHLVLIEDHLKQQCSFWESSYYLFSAADGGYQYLHDILFEAESLEVMPDRFREHFGMNTDEYYPDAQRRERRIARAMQWLEKQMSQSPALTTSTTLMRTQEPPSIQLLHITKEQLAFVLAECGITPSSKAGKWAAISSALRRLHMLDGSHTAVQQWLTQHFGAPASIRRTLSDKGDHNAVFSSSSEKLVLEQALQLLKKYRNTL